jgi:hypothetical protein
VKAIIGGIVLVFFVAYALGMTYEAGKQVGRGGSSGSNIEQAIAGIGISLFLAFYLGQEYPYVELFGWLF